MIAQTLMTGIAIVLVSLVNAEHDADRHCQLIPVGSKLPSMENCQDYYICSPNLTALKTTCPDDSVFDKDRQSCIPQTESNCYHGLANPCANKHLEFAYCSKGCNWFNWCEYGQIVGNATCKPGQKFNVAWQNCTYGECDSSNRYAVPDMCNIMQDGVYFGDFENCAAWHQCHNAQKESGFCQDNLVFDAVSGGCRKFEGNMCQRTGNSNYKVPGGPPEWNCYDASQIVGDAHLCSRYYVCEMYTYVPEIKYRWATRNCKNGYFDVISNTCRSTYAARPFPTCDRCELVRGSQPTYFVNAIDTNCNKYVTCKNGKRTVDDIKSCPQWEYYNEKNQVCDGNEQRWSQYEASGGPCQDYDCNEVRECYKLSSAPEGPSYPEFSQEIVRE